MRFDVAADVPMDRTLTEPDDSDGVVWDEEPWLEWLGTLQASLQMHNPNDQLTPAEITSIVIREYRHTPQATRRLLMESVFELGSMIKAHTTIRQPRLLLDVFQWLVGIAGGYNTLMLRICSYLLLVHYNAIDEGSMPTASTMGSFTLVGSEVNGTGMFHLCVCYKGLLLYKI